MFLKVFRFSFTLRRVLKCFVFVILLSIVSFYKTNFFSDDGIADRSQRDSLASKRKLASSKILSIIHGANKEERILNVDTFGPITADTIIIVILLDKNSSGFKFVISSLSQVRGIEEALVIFSHSYFDEKTNSVIRSIDFCRVLQIYYPYSIQTHPEEFPGYDPSDCPYDSNFLSLKRNCTGLLFRDVRGHFRNPPVAERKHHWWWTANNIFENFSSTARHTGLFIFSEDNYIFMKDFIYMASYMKNVANSLPQCEFLSLGSDTTPVAPEKMKLTNLYSVELSPWNPKEHSRLLAFDMSVWNSIVSHYDVFCTLDDASWLRSLYFISVHRRDGKRFKTLSAVTPRAFKIDSCASEFGFFGSRCDLVKNVLTVTEIDKLNDENLFPSHLELYINVELEDEDVIFDYSEGKGGWADPRDWALCRNMTAGKIKKILMEMRNEFHEYFGDKNWK